MEKSVIFLGWCATLLVVCVVLELLIQPKRSKWGLILLPLTFGMGVLGSTTLFILASNLKDLLFEYHESFPGTTPMEWRLAVLVMWTPCITFMVGRFVRWKRWV